MLPPLPGIDAAVQQRVAGADRTERRVGVPQPVGQRVHPAAVVARAQLVARGEVGDVAELQPVAETAVLRLGHLAGQRHLQLAEIAAELELLFVGQRLVAEHQHGVAVHAGLDRGNLFPAQRLRNVDAGHLADEDRMDRTDADAHCGTLLPEFSGHYRCRRQARKSASKRSRHASRLLRRITASIAACRSRRSSHAHRQAAIQRRGHPGLVVRIDDQRRIQFARRAGELRQHQNARIVRILRRDILLRHQVHPVAQRRHQPDLRLGIERHQRTAREAAVQIAQRHPVHFGEAAVDAAGLGFQLVPDLAIGLDVAARWRRDLHEHHVALVLRKAARGTARTR